AVRSPRPLVSAVPADAAVPGHDDRADHRIGSRPAAAAGGQEQRPRHVGLVAHHFSSKRPFTYSDASHGTRSSSPSPTPTYRIGSFRSWAMATATPPLAVPSSLVS